MSQWTFDKAPRCSVDGRYWRMLSPRWQHQPLSGAGAARAGGRWNGRGVPALYLSADHGTAIAEYMQALVHPGTLTAFDVVSDAMIDLTSADVRTRLAVSDALLTLPWRHIRDVEQATPESWAFADAAIAAGCHGMLVPSTTVQGAANLVLWRWGSDGAHVTPVDPYKELGRPELQEPVWKFADWGFPRLAIRDSSSVPDHPRFGADAGQRPGWP